MRTSFYLTLAIAALFISSSEARHLRNRAGTELIVGLLGGASGIPLGSLTGVTGGVVDAKSHQAQNEKKKRDVVGGGSDSFIHSAGAIVKPAVEASTRLANNVVEAFGSVNGLASSPGSIPKLEQLANN